jgi:uncharacterized protein
MYMKKIILTFLILFSACCAVRAVDIPAGPDGYVTDRAHLYDSSTRSEMESKLAAFDRATSSQIFIFTFPSLENEPIENVSIKVAERWKAGRKGKDNGIIILIARDDRKVRIEVGYGLEGAIPDILASRIMNEYMIPEFREGRYGKGTKDAITILMAAAKGEYFKGMGPRSKEEDIVITKEAVIGILTWVFTIIAVFFIVTVPVDIAGYNKYKKQNRVLRGIDPYFRWWLKASLFIIVLHFLLRIFFEILVNMIFSRGYGMGGRSGGGFSGGGGGRFGGGGASGGW